MQRSLLVVKLIAMLTNLAMYLVPSPVADDYMSGRVYPMLRWAEWTVLSCAPLCASNPPGADAWRLEPSTRR